jgi:hypothetical protein
MRRWMGSRSGGYRARRNAPRLTAGSASVHSVERHQPHKESDRIRSSQGAGSSVFFAFAVSCFVASLIYYNHETGSSGGLFDNTHTSLVHHPAPPDTVRVLGDQAFRIAASDAARLATTEMKVIQPMNSEVYRPIPVFEDPTIHLFTEIPMTITAGFDCDVLGGSNVTNEYSDGRLVVTVNLPAPSILSCCADYSEIYRHSEEFHYPGTAQAYGQLIADTEMLAADSARARAVEAGILEEAEESARTRIFEIMTALGADEVHVIIDGNETSDDRREARGA